ncbi:MAG TPA: TonB-dependent receptor [Allosphingosinicella sp.]|jgi:TonB-dependent receptor|nr:TonB-dependent receptor [Allosphingosinicella sp.]
MGPDLDILSRGTARWLAAASAGAIALCAATPAAAQASANVAVTAAAQPPANGGNTSPAAGQPTTNEAEVPNEAAEPEIVVTGFRSSLARALNMKQRENGETDTILAEDIGKFPDLNLSESIQRIPGVALQRDAGEGREISVRGLGAQFTRVRIDGMEALTTTGGADASGGTNRSRSFDFNVFASDLFNAITVRKTAEASVEEGSLGATVDLRTARPFDYKGFTLTASAQGDYNDLSNKVTPRGAFLISDIFANGTLGALFSVAYTKHQILEEGPSTVRWAPATSFAPGFQSVGGISCLNAAGTTALSPAPGGCAAVDTAQHPRFPRQDWYYDDQQRIGATASLQWKPSPNTLISLDALYADFKGTREERYLEAPSFSVGGACTAANRANSCGIADTDVVSDKISNGVMYAGTFNDVDLRVENRFDRLDTKFEQLTLEGTQKFGENVTLSFLGGTSSSKHNNPVQNTLTFDQFNVQGYSYDYGAPNGRNPIFNFGSANLTSPTSWVLSQIRLRAATAYNYYTTGDLGLNWKLNDEFQVDVGGSWKRYKFVTTELRRENPASPNTNQESVIPAAIAATSLSQFSHVVDIAGYNFLAPNYFAADNLFHFGDPSAFGGAFALGPGPALGNNATVKERDEGGFLQFTFSHEFGAVRVRGNAGVRYVDTREDSTGYSVVANQIQQITVRNSYDDWLPSANLVIEPMRNLNFRFAAARVMSRPNLTNLNPGATINVSGANRTVSAGNPFLQPFRASSYDAAVEWYFMPGGLISVALFEKDVDSFISTLQSRGTFAQNPFGLPTSLATAACGNLSGCDATTTIFTFSSPSNTPGGPVRGFEINYQQPFTFLPGVLHNFGVLLNYTGVKSKIKYLNAAGGVVAITDLTQLSRRSANATLYYEDKVISARVSAAYRSKYLTQVPASEAGNDVQGTNGTLNIDASLQVTINPHLKITLEGINLTDQYQDQFVDSRDMLSVYHHTGREVLFGVRYTY